MNAEARGPKCRGVRLVPTGRCERREEARRGAFGWIRVADLPQTRSLAGNNPSTRGQIVAVILAVTARATSD